MCVCVASIKRYYVGGVYHLIHCHSFVLRPGRGKLYCRGPSHTHTIGLEPDGRNNWHKEYSRKEFIRRDANTPKNINAMIHTRKRRNRRCGEERERERERKMRVLEVREQVSTDDDRNHHRNLIVPHLVGCCYSLGVSCNRTDGRRTRRR